MHHVDEHSNLKIMEKLYRASSFEVAAQVLLEAAKSMTDCESVALRMLQEDNWIPHLAWKEVSPQFIRDEGIVRKTDCICGMVARGSGLTRPGFTSQGSFVSNSAKEYMAYTADLGSGCRNRCLAEGYQSLGIFPVKDGKQVVGVLHAASKNQECLLPSAIKELEGICAHSGGALSRMAQKNIASLLSSLNKALMPSPKPRIGGLEIGFSYKSATDPRAIGGDFYELVPLGKGKLAMVVGDFVGHGVEATGMAARCRTTLGNIFMETKEPASALTKADTLLFRTMPEDKFVTAAAVLLDESERSADIALAGHPPVVKIDLEGKVSENGRNFLPLAVTSESQYQSDRIPFLPGETLVAFTDGLIECRDQRGELYGLERLLESCKQEQGLSAQGLAERLTERALAFASMEIPDDDTMVLVVRNEGRPD